MKINAVTLLSSALCDLRCKYCYISQDAKMKDVQKELLNKIRTEPFLEPILKRADDPKEIEHLGLWGLEPSKTLDIVAERFDYIFESLPALKSISFSSNFQNNSEKIIDFISKIPKRKKIKIGVQFSLDGMPKINDMSRGRGSGEKIVKNVKTLIEELNKILPSLPDVTVDLHDKGTLTASVIEQFDKDRELLHENYLFLENFYKDLYSLKSTDAKIHLGLGGANQEQPFPYSKAHGIAFSNVVRALGEIMDREKTRYISLPLMGKFDKIFKFGSEFNNKHFMFTCNANVANVSIGMDSDVMSFCHRDFFPNNDEHTQKFIQDHYLISDAQNLTKREYITYAYAHFPKLKLSYIIMMCKELAYCGLIDKKYDDYKNAYIVAAYLVADLCPSSALGGYASPYINELGNIKFLCNGAFDYFLERMAKRL